MQRSKRVALATVFVLLVVSVVAVAAPASAQGGRKPFAGITLVGISWGGVWTDGTQAIFCGSLELDSGGTCRIGSSNSATMISKVIAEKDNPQVDFIFVDDAYVPELMANKALQKIDFAKIPNAGGYFGRVQKQAEEFGGYYLPVGIQEMGIGYRADILKEKNLPVPTKWADLWNPAYKGKVVIPAWTTNFGWAFIEAAAAARCGDAKNLDCGYQEVKKLRDAGQLSLVVDTGTALEKAFATGEAWVGMSNNGRVFAVQDKGVDIKFVNPEDYRLTSSWGVVATRRGPNWDALMALFNRMSDPRNQAVFLEQVPYGPSTARAREFMNAKSLLRLTTSESAWTQMHMVNWDHLRQRRQELVERFNREIAR
jgi:putative spermidine/putrescine transport system substrate-binding protein